MKNNIINNIEQLIAENEKLKKENYRLKKANEEMNSQLKNFKKVKHDRDRYKQRLDEINEKDDLEKWFVDGCKHYDRSIEILNWYRNLYYKELPNTEREKMARAINDVFMTLKNMGVNLNEV